MKGRRIAAPGVICALPLMLGLTGCLGDSNDGGATPGTGSPDAEAPTEVPEIAVTQVASGLTQPLHITHAGEGSGRLFIVEKPGEIRVVRDGTLDDAPWLDLTAEVHSDGNEQGLLGLAFPPDFPDRRHFYVVYTDQAEDVVLKRYPLLSDSDAVDQSGGEVVLTIPQPFANHNGGKATFGPDGLLYLSLGDGGSGGDPLGNGQDRSTLLGTILRLDVEGPDAGTTYAVPPDNPFVGEEGAREEIWAWGLRNPWRFSFDAATGDLFIADVGQNGYEEVNFQAATSPGGENYGWNIMEGAHCFMPQDCNPEGLTLPVVEYENTGGAGGCAVTGGYVYRGEQYPDLQGIYVYADFCSGRIHGLRQVDGEWEDAPLLESGLQISTFGEDETGELYVADYGAGNLYRIVVP